MEPEEKYITYLDSVFQIEPIIYTNKFIDSPQGRVSAIVYRDIPDTGFVTSVTYGLSLKIHPEWKFGRPELSLTVKSKMQEWGTITGYVADSFGDECLFKYGQVINIGQRIADDSEMTAFFVFAPSILSKELYSSIDIGLPYKINLAALYPIYESEIKVLHKIGLKRFWHHPDFDMYDIQRKRIAI